ncbi:kinase-like domain-containing protein [Rhizophagus irregularis DAOM 181602=DAOM 197198]|nr:kinase-like domain-containing protein [Rhizophagus irregularis DAOM 181602=DAOM 197198]
MHRDLHSNNVLVHQKTIKLADFGLSKRIEEISNSQSKTFGLIPYTDLKSFDRSTTEFYLLNKKSDVYSVGVLLWKISSCKPPFHGKPYDVDCWNTEPDNRPTINQVVDELKVLITKVNIIIKDFHLLYNDTNNVQSLNNHQLPNLNISESTNSSHGELSQVIQNFNMMNTKDIESSISSINKFEDNFNIIFNNMFNFFYDDDEVAKQKVLSYLNEQNITLQKINNLLLNNQNNSNTIYLLGKFNHLGIGISVDEQKAFDLYQKAANLGNSLGINDLGKFNWNINLGGCYEKGIGTDIDYQKAFELYQKAANLGYSSGINNLGHCYQNGIGTDIDKEKAFKLYQNAAELGDSSGINNLGYCYQIGIGTDIDKKKAFELYQRAADLGNSSGIYNLGLCYRNGIGTDIDKKKAFELHQKAADLGDSFGVNSLGYCYLNGIGTYIDKEKAFKLYQKAADLGNSFGINNLGNLYQYGIGTDIDKKKDLNYIKKLQI